MDVTLPELSPPSKSNLVRIFLIPLMLGLMLPVLCCGILPVMGVFAFSDELSFKILVFFFIFLAGGTAYWYYADAVNKYPTALLFLSYISVPWLSWLNTMARERSINIYETLLLAFLFCIPAFLLGFRYRALLMNRVTYLKAFCLYATILLVYYFFFNHNVQDQRTNPGMFSLGYHFVFNVMFQLSLTLITSVAIYTVRYPEKLFRAFNALVITLVAVYGLASLIAYPYGGMVLEDTGVKRATFIFVHANQLSHYMGLSVLYLIGLYFHHLFTRNTKHYKLFLSISITLGFLAFVLAFSKTAMASFGMSAFLIILLNLASWQRITQLLKVLVLLPAVMGGAFAGFVMMSGENPLDMMMLRVAQTSSIDWRYRVWDYLLYDITPGSMLLGHGLSGASERMSIFEGFNVDKVFIGGYMKIVNVHNAYLSNFYDFGLLGFILLGALGVFTLKKLMSVMKTPLQLPSRALDIQVIGLMVYYLISCGCDTTFEMLEIPFWIFIALSCGLSDRMRHQWITR